MSMVVVVKAIVKVVISCCVIAILGVVVSMRVDLNRSLADVTALRQLLLSSTSKSNQAFQSIEMETSRIQKELYGTVADALV